MKKQRILSLPMFIFLLLIGLQFGCGGVRKTTSDHNNIVDQSTLNKRIIGTWQMCKKDSTVNTNLYKKGFVRYKIISDKSFINVEIKKHKRSNYNTIYGSYELKDGIYTEFVESTSYGFKHVLGQRNPFRVKIVGDLMFLEGLNGNWKEIWKKLK